MPVDVSVACVVDEPSRGRDDHWITWNAGIARPALCDRAGRRRPRDHRRRSRCSIRSAGVASVLRRSRWRTPLAGGAEIREGTASPRRRRPVWRPPGDGFGVGPARNWIRRVALDHRRRRRVAQAPPRAWPRAGTSRAPGPAIGPRWGRPTRVRCPDHRAREDVAAVKRCSVVRRPPPGTERTGVAIVGAALAKVRRTTTPPGRRTTTRTSVGRPRVNEASGTSRCCRRPSMTCATSTAPSGERVAQSSNVPLRTARSSVRSATSAVASGARATIEGARSTTIARSGGGGASTGTATGT